MRNNEKCTEQVPSNICALVCQITTYPHLLSKKFSICAHFLSQKAQYTCTLIDGGVGGWYHFVPTKFSLVLKTKSFIQGLIRSLGQNPMESMGEGDYIQFAMMLSIAYVIVGLAIGFLMATIKDFILSKPPGRCLSFIWQVKITIF